MTSPDTVVDDGARLRITPRRIQVCLGVIWLIDGALQLQPFMFGHGFISDVLEPATQGQPGIVAWPMTTAIHIIGSNIAAWNSIFATIQILLGIGLLFRRTVRLALAASFLWALAVWWLGEGLGQVLTGASPVMGAPGAVILYLVVGALVWPSRREQSGSVASVGPLGEQAARYVWALLWVGLAFSALLPGNRGGDALSQMIMGNADGEPTPIAWMDRRVAGLVHGLGLPISVTLAALAVMIGLGVLLRARYTVVLILGVAVSTILWVVGQNFGELGTGSATDVNAGPLFVLLAACLYQGTPTTRPLARGLAAGGEARGGRRSRARVLHPRWIAVAGLVTIGSFPVVAGATQLGQEALGSGATVAPSMTPSGTGAPTMQMHEETTGPRGQDDKSPGGQMDMDPGGQGTIRRPDLR